MYPKVNINYQNGALGQVQEINDGIAALGIICDISAATDPELTSGTVYTIYSLADADNKGFSQIRYAYAQIADFYKEAAEGSKLYVVMSAETTTMETMISTDGALNNLLRAKKDVKFYGICRNTGDSYTPTYTNGIDSDVDSALARAQTLNETLAGLQQPVFGLIDGRDYQGTTADLQDHSGSNNNRAGIVMVTSQNVKDNTNTTYGHSAAIGLILGRISDIPVQRKISRVKSGAINASDMFLTDGTPVSEATNDIQAINTKRFITCREFTGLNGYYWTNDCLACDVSDDYSNISYRRPMNKLHRIAYETYVNKVDDEILINADGTMDSMAVKELEGLVENDVQILMVSKNEFSGFSVHISPSQNVVSTGELVINAQPTPVGYSREITVNLAFNV
ncbi:MAG: DUF2586 family protein [Bacteroidales bacterium]|nr:DUF2586 family protein [Bacteroidales bacterium]